jgi:hypothetical protein
MTKQISYTGRGFDSIVNYIDSNGVNGTIYGKIVRITGEKIADVEFTIQNDNLFLFVDGQVYSSISSALITLEARIAQNSADGSLGTGNTANNVIGNYAIFRHVLFGNTSLEQIIGKSDNLRVRVFKGDRRQAVSVANTRLLSLTARDGIYKKYSFGTVSAIAKKYKYSSKQMSFLLDNLTTNEMELMFGSSVNNFDLSVYGI